MARWPGAQRPVILDVMTACIECLPEPPSRSLQLVETDEQPAASEYVLAVTLRDEDGGEWRATGGGPTLWDALACAVASAPAGRSWRPVRWTELYAD